MERPQPGPDAINDILIGCTLEERTLIKDIGLVGVDGDYTILITYRQAMDQCRAWSRLVQPDKLGGTALGSSSSAGPDNRGFDNSMARERSAKANAARDQLRVLAQRRLREQQSQPKQPLPPPPGFGFGPKRPPPPQRAQERREPPPPPPQPQPGQQPQPQPGPEQAAGEPQPQLQPQPQWQPPPPVFKQPPPGPAPEQRAAGPPPFKQPPPPHRQQGPMPDPGPRMPPQMRCLVGLGRLCAAAAPAASAAAARPTSNSWR